MKRDQLPIDDLNNADRMLAIIIIAGFVSITVWTLVKLCQWVFA